MKIAHFAQILLFGAIVLVPMTSAQETPGDRDDSANVQAAFDAAIADDESVSAIDGPVSLSARYYPLTTGNEYYYKAVKAKAPNRELRVKSEIKNRRTVDGKDYFYLFAPSENVRYLIRRDNAGMHMRLLKREFRLFGLSFNVDLKPEILFLRFPLEVGDQWSQRVTASARILFIPISRTIEASYHVVDRVIVHTEAGDIDAFVVNANLGVVGGEIASKTFWYGENVGYIKASSPDDSLIIAGYRVFDEQNGLWIDRSPPDVGRYK